MSSGGVITTILGTNLIKLKWQSRDPLWKTLTGRDEDGKKNLRSGLSSA